MSALSAATLGDADAPNVFSLKELTMKAKFIIGTRGLPKDLTTPEAQTKYTHQLTENLKNSVGVTQTSDAGQAKYGFIIGTLLNKEMFAPNAAGVQTAINDAFLICQGKTPDVKGIDVSNSAFLSKTLGLIVAKRNDRTLSFQEFAYVGKYMLDNARAVPPNSSPEYLGRQIDIALDKYVSGSGPSDSIEIPSLTSEAVPLEVEPPNIEVIAKAIYPSLQLERMRLFDVVDRITELYMNGLLPIGGDAAGTELDDYQWSAEDRLNASQRYSIYARVLGAAGGDVSKEVQPNRQFDTLFLRFVSSLSEYDRQRRVADLITTSQASTLTSEQVRKSGRELASNASLYGWGGAHAAARRLRDHVVRALNILSLPQIQKVYGVSSPYQVIERVAMNEFGQAPDVVKYRTMAESGKVILGLVAKYASAWNTNTGRPLFASATAPAAVPDIPPEDQSRLIIEAQNWLAVNGIQNEQVDKMSQPSDSAFAPSMPAFGGGSATAKPPAAGPDVMNKLQQMFASGTPPTVDQIKAMLPAIGA